MRDRELRVEQPQITLIPNDYLGDYWVHFPEPFFSAGTNPKRFESVRTWVHEFTEESLVELMGRLMRQEDLKPWGLRFIDPLRRFRHTTVPHLMVALHTRSYINERELTSDEYAKETIRKFIE